MSVAPAPGYLDLAPDSLRRARVLTIVLVLHLLALVVWVGQRDYTVALEKGASGGPTTIALIPAEAAPSAADALERPGGGAQGTDGAAREPSAAHAQGPLAPSAAPGRGPDRGRAESAASPSLAASIDSVLRDNPMGGAARLNYRALLLRHIERYRTYAGDARRSGATGRVTLRFRVDRSGRVIDAVVVRSASGMLSEGALQTLWRAEPLPGVPLDLPSPLEVDIPIDFESSRRIGA